MKFLSFNVFRPSISRLNISDIKREDILFWGIILLVFIFILVILWNGYLFYHNILEERQVVIKTVNLSPDVSIEIDEVLKILDERQNKFESDLKKP